MTTAASHPTPDAQAVPGWDEPALERLRRDLLRFAELQLRNHELAEDAVQDALASALSARDRFESRASMKTWLFSILKNKIIDIFRDRWNKGRVELHDDGAEDADFDILFNSHDRWRKEDRPTAWGDPEQSFENQQFWLVFEACMTHLPDTTARVFSMREFLGLEVAEICKELALTSSNCWVILHRARMQLRLCLQQRWFGRE